MTDMLVSGEWVGYYMYSGKNALCPMHLTLNFDRGEIRGAGIDNPGRFVIEGSYDEGSFWAEWVKRYVDKHGVQYKGMYKDGGIRGTWSLSQMNQGSIRSSAGEFCIWPLPSGQYSDDEPLQGILEKEIRRKVLGKAGDSEDTR